MQTLRNVALVLLAMLAMLAMLPAVADERLTGSYVGILPCADCPGIDVRLDLFADGSFHQRSVYRERERSFDRVGRWTRADGTVELRYGHGERRRFRHGNGWLTLLDEDGQPIRSELNYTLNRSSLLSRIEPQVTLDGHFTYMADSALLEDCATGRRMPVAMEGEYLTLERAWSRSGASMQRPLPVRLEARIVERVNMEGPLRHTVVVTRVVQTGSAVSCAPTAAAAAPKPLAALTERVVRVFRPGVPTVEPQVVTPPVEPVARVPAPSAEPPQRAVQTFELVSPPPPPVSPRVEPVAQAPTPPAQAPQPAVQTFELVSPPPPPVAPLAEAKPAPALPSPPASAAAAATPAPAPIASPAPVLPTAGGPTLHGTQWRLIQLGARDIAMTDRERMPYIMFAPSESPRFSGFTGCNRFTGGTTMFGGSILFSGIATTKMACPDSANIEQDFLAALGQARNWRVVGQHFELSDDGGKLVARFEAVR